ncbi:MAG: tellurium resistance protein TerC [Mariniblastus sp.]|nr:tellurium resistance protein TerC [Mariniblastus sp.]
MKPFRFLNRSAILAVMVLILLSLCVDSVGVCSALGLETVTETTGTAVKTASPGLVENLIALGLLVLLQAVLGFDNLLYISLESKHAPLEKQQMVRTWGIGLAIFFRIGLLFLLVYLQDLFEKVSVFDIAAGGVQASFNLHSLIVLLGGTFIIYTAMKEIWHMTRLDPSGHEHADKPKKSITAVIGWIVLMNIVFSFDSILSAIALTDVLWVMALAIVISGLLMIWLSDRVSNFLSKNRMYEVLGLFVLFVVGIMLVSEGGHLAHINLWGNPIVPMTKTTFYFVLGILVLTDIVQSRYQKKLLAEAQNGS